MLVLYLPSVTQLVFFIRLVINIKIKKKNSDIYNKTYKYLWICIYIQIQKNKIILKINVNKQ